MVDVLLIRDHVSRQYMFNLGLRACFRRNPHSLSKVSASIQSVYFVRVLDVSVRLYDGRVMVIFHSNENNVKGWNTMA
jgi:hypothetical protein